LQEPWHNPYKNVTYCPSLGAFYIAYNSEERLSCFLINKSLNISLWDVDYSRPDVCSLKLQLSDITLWIYNFYNQLPGSYYTINYPSLLPLLLGLLAREGKHLILRDFNLYHPLWSSLKNLTTYVAINIVVEALLAKDIELATL
jgi:hypothetical protein